MEANTPAMDIVNAGSGDDTITGSLGSDLIDGSDGSDTLTYAGLANPITIVEQPFSNSGQLYSSRFEADKTGGAKDYVFSVEHITLTNWQRYPQRNLRRRWLAVYRNRHGGGSGGHRSP